MSQFVDYKVKRLYNVKHVLEKLHEYLSYWVTVVC